MEVLVCTMLKNWCLSYVSFSMLRQRVRSIIWKFGKTRYSPDACLWVSTLGGSEAYRLGELAERSRQIGWSLATVCDMLDINQDWLIAAVKSMLRKERHNGRWDNPNLTCWMGREDKERLRRCLSNKRGEFDYHPWYSSTGRKKAWCE